MALRHPGLPPLEVREENSLVAIQLYYSVFFHKGLFGPLQCHLVLCEVRGAFLEYDECDIWTIAFDTHRNGMGVFSKASWYGEEFLDLDSC